MKVTHYSRGYVEQWGVEIGGTIFMSTNQFFTALDQTGQLSKKIESSEYSKHSDVYYLGKQSTRLIAFFYDLEIQKGINYQIVVGRR